MATRGNSPVRNILLSKPVIAVLVILIAFVGTLEYKQLRKRAQYNKEIAALQKQESDLIAKNKALQDGLDYFNNDEYKEKVARQQLNLKKDGEIVVNFPPAVGNQTENAQPAPQPSNPQKWWNYFFNRDQK